MLNIFFNWFQFALIIIISLITIYFLLFTNKFENFLDKKIGGVVNGVWKNT